MKLYLESKHLILRLVEIDDAEFIFELRRKKGKYLSPTTSLEQQVKFIQEYKKREEEGNEYYFVIVKKKNKDRLGVVRIYDLRTINGKRAFSWGSWIIKDGAPNYAAVESALIVYEFGFFIMHRDLSHFDVVKANKHVISFHKKFGAKIIGEDAKNFYFHFSKEDYLKIRKKFYSRFLKV